MDKEQLMKYIKAAISLETDMATQEGLISAYEKDSQTRKPQLLLQEEPKQPSAPVQQEYHVSFLDSDWTSTAFVCSIVCFVVAAVLFFAMFVEWSCGLVAVGLVIAGRLLYIPVTRRKQAVADTNEDLNKRYRNEMEQYRQDCMAIKAANASIISNFDSNMGAWKKNANENITVLQSKLSKTKGLLDELYDKDFIYGKYRNLPALTSIYEFFLTGRCDELTGPHGAYNLDEDEVRKDMVISQLSTVIDNLEQIKTGQYMLYQQVKKIKDEISLVDQELQKIKGHVIQLTQLAELQTYYAALTERNTDISATMHLLNG